jgi:toxin ParE1/3/4
VAKPVQLRRRAADDINAALDHYRRQAGRAVAVRFVNALERALNHVARHPHNGSLRFAYELGIPELRCWPIPRFPYLIFYVDHDNQIDVWRILHTRRDVPAALAGISEG